MMTFLAMTRLARRGLLMAALTLPMAFSGAQAAWPDKPMRIVLPFGPGGVADVTARILADRLSTKLGQRVVIENMPGPGGIAAARAVTTAPADGSTFGLIANGTAAGVGAFNNLPFDPVKDFAPVSMVGLFDLVLVVNAASEFKTLEDFLKAAKANPGKYNVGTIAVGSTQNLGAELFKSLSGLNITIVPYKNSPDITVALLRDDVHLMVEFPPTVSGQVADGKLRLVATSSPSENALLPGVPPANKAVPGYEVVAWNAIVAPKNTPPETVAALNKAIREVVAMPDVKEAYAKVGVIAYASSPDELTQRLTADIKKWTEVIEKAGIPKK